MNRYIRLKSDYLKLKSKIDRLDFHFVGGAEDKITILSESIKEGTIDKKYAKKYSNMSPHIKITNIPPNTKQLVLLIYDPDAVKVVGKVFIHWFLLLNPGETELKEGTKIGREMINDYNNRGYGGPNPPPKQKHTYHFKVFAVTDGLTFDENHHYSYDELKTSLNKYDSSEFIAEYKSM